MALKCNDLTQVLSKFDETAMDLSHRYHSFDFCYAHFRQTRALPAEQRDIEKSCQVLWGYLASWGMLRGSSFLLQKNPSYLTDLVEWIYAQPESTWEIEVKDYAEKSKQVLALYDEAKAKILKGGKHQAVTLVTKILLGVFAIVPAFDRFFKDTFSEMAGKECGFSTPNKTSLDFISKFYQANQIEIDTLCRERVVKDFLGKPTAWHYSQAKIIDMYGFQKGLDRSTQKGQ
ncbi:hypothetical protein B0187_09845 [Haemophilus paracuniculus]|uniref:Uncharacterized protein n=1 Tax=Haemophilus paracuniculus TaxID=734 RepID=A0A1T0APW2_9PAST|nr:hypothetical protein [Haemophilus paracuniculus]OOR98090.1 hypothetical protein B0187_09845 [Haemophilus paracuniculus]